jgi:hypothetical protein
MRKILLGTTAVVGLAIAAPAAFAQGIAPGSGTQGQTLTAAPAPGLSGVGGLTVRLGGYFEFSAANIQDDNDRAARANLGDKKARQRNDFRNDLELVVFVDGRAAGVSSASAPKIVLRPCLLCVRRAPVRWVAMRCGMNLWCSLALRPALVLT